MSVSPISGEEGLFIPTSSVSSQSNKRKYSVQCNAHSFVTLNQISNFQAKQKKRNKSRRKNKSSFENFHDISKSGLLFPNSSNKNITN